MLPGAGSQQDTAAADEQQEEADFQAAIQVPDLHWLATAAIILVLSFLILLLWHSLAHLTAC